MSIYQRARAQTSRADNTKDNLVLVENNNKYVVGYTEKETPLPSVKPLPECPLTHLLDVSRLPTFNFENVQ